MDDAIDAMKDFWFEEKLIKSTVKEILKLHLMFDVFFLIFV